MDLNDARVEINSIDSEIVHLLEKRFNVVIEIGNYKKENNIPVYDEKREQNVISNCVSYLEDEQYSKYILDIYKQIMNSCKELQNE